MNSTTDSNNQNQQPDKDKHIKDKVRKETNKTDPQLTELKGLVDPEEPLEEEGTLNPLTGNTEDSK